MSNYIPLALADVSTEWLQAALQDAFPGVEIIESRLEGPFGYKPNKAKVFLTFAPGKDAGAPSQLIVKGGFPNEGNGGAGLDLGMQLEMLAYRDAEPLFSMNMPHPYYIGFDEAAGQGILLLPDLSLQGAHFHNVFKVLTYPQAAAFMDLQGDFHAASWNSETFKEGGKLGPASAIGRVGTTLLNEVYWDRLMADPQYFAAHIELPRGAALPRCLRDPARMTKAVSNVIEMYRRQPVCYIHGDEHLGNLYRQADGTPGFIDPAGRIGAWNVGVTNFLVQALDVADRREWERSLLARYLDRLKLNGVQPPSFEEAWFVHKCTTIHTLIIWINNSPRWQSEAINTANCVRAAFAVLDHDALNLLGA